MSYFDCITVVLVSLLMILLITAGYLTNSVRYKVRKQQKCWRMYHHIGRSEDVY